MVIYALAGPPGAGKTHYKDHHPMLCALPFIDVADVYLDYPGIQPSDAFSELLQRITVFIDEDNASQDIVVEAVFKAGGIQRTWLEYVAQMNEYKIEYVDIDTPLKECLSRIEADWKKSNQDVGTRARYEARKRIVLQYISDEEREEDHPRSDTRRVIERSPTKR